MITCICTTTEDTACICREPEDLLGIVALESPDGAVFYVSQTQED